MTITEFSARGVQSQILLLFIRDYLKSMSSSLFCARDLWICTEQKMALAGMEDSSYSIFSRF